VRTLGPAGLTAREPPAGDFRRQFRALQEQWEELDREARALERPNDAAAPAESRSRSAERR
jgi:hypothetical protein